MQDRLRNGSWKRWVLCQSLKEVRDIGCSQCLGPWAELISNIVGVEELFLERWGGHSMVVEMEVLARRAV